MTKILIADNHMMFSECLQLVLSKQAYEVVGMAVDGVETVKMATELRPHIVLLEVNMPKMHGLDVAKEFKRVLPSVRLVFLTCRTDEACLREALQAGAKGYILKSESLADLQTALRKVSEGELYVSAGFLTNLIVQWMQNPHTPDDREVLSLRESQVLKLIAEGHSTKQIAGLLSISPKTADSHRARLMAKLGVYDIAGLVRYAIQRGI